MEHSNPGNEPACDVFTSTVDKVKSLTDEGIHKAEVYARRYPGKAVAWSIAAGFLLPRLPVATLVGLIGRLALSLIRPLILVLGIARLCELAGCCKDKSCKLP